MAFSLWLTMVLLLAAIAELEGGDAPVCDYPIGSCYNKNDPCPSGTKKCNVGCDLSTNRCCCNNQPSTGSVTPKPTGGFEPGKCDWPTGACYNIQDDCPPGTRLCAENNKGCELATNHCCCYIEK